MKRRAVFRLALARVVEASGGDVGMAEPLLHLAISASCESALVAVVARIECTHTPIASALIPLPSGVQQHAYFIVLKGAYASVVVFPEIFDIIFSVGVPSVGDHFNRGIS